MSHCRVRRSIDAWMPWVAWKRASIDSSNNETPVIGRGDDPDTPDIVKRRFVTTVSA